MQLNGKVALITGDGSGDGGGYFSGNQGWNGHRLALDTAAERDRIRILQLLHRRRDEGFKHIDLFVYLAKASNTSDEC